MKVFVMLLAVALATAAEKCTKYEGKGELKDGECRLTKKDYIYHQPCKAPKVCNDPVGNITKCGDPDKYTRLPGEYCATGDDCRSKTCDDKTKLCKGKNEGEICTLINDCDLGLRCIPEAAGAPVSKCAKAVAPESPCNVTHDCVVPYGCISGVCSKIGTLENKQKANETIHCKSFYISESTEASEKVCTDPPMLSKDGKKLSAPVTCQADDKCTYKFDGVDKKIACECGMTIKETKYCKIYPIDIEFAAVFFTR